MALEVNTISTEIIKPSSPTPIHLRSLKLSFLDQIAPPIYIPLIFFYSHLQNLTHHQTSSLLKYSLSKTLTIFYPLAGGVRQNLSVDCDDSGVEFIEARVHTTLSRVIQDPEMEQLKKLQPVEPLQHEENVLLKVKACFFDCGGISVAISMSHKIADGTSLVAFINAWAASCRGGNSIFLNPVFDLSSRIPPQDPSAVAPMVKSGMTEEAVVTKRFVFDEQQVAKLRENFSPSLDDGGSDSPKVKSPTRVEAVSSYIWRFFINNNSTKTTSFAAIHAVNLRPRRTPPFQEQIFGNCWRNATALSKPGDGDFDMATKLRAAVEVFDNDLIGKIENGEYLDILKKLIGFFRNSSGVDFCYFSSWSRFPVYEADFGWGKPVWVCTTTMPLKNFVVLMSTPCGKGIEAWINLVEEDMKMLERHYSLIA